MLSWIMDNWLLSSGLTLLFIVALWWFDARDGQRRTDAFLEIGERADEALGGLTGAVGGVTILVVSLMITVGTQLADALGQLALVASQSPVVAGNLITALVGYLGLNGSLGITPMQFVAFALVVAMLVVGVRRNRN